MSTAFTDISTVERINSSVLADEIERAYIERTTLDVCEVDTSNFIVNDYDMWRRWQGIVDDAIKTMYHPGFVDISVLADVMPLSTEIEYVSIQQIFTVAGLPYNHFRAYTEHPDNGGAVEYRFAERGDIIGPWLWEDLQAVMGALTSTLDGWELNDYWWRDSRGTGNDSFLKAADNYDAGNFWHDYHLAHCQSGNNTSDNNSYASRGFEKYAYTHASDIDASVLGYADFASGIYDIYGNCGDHSFSENTKSKFEEHSFSNGQTNTFTLGDINRAAPRAQNTGYYANNFRCVINWDFTNK